jgi:hypothetical protein
LGFAFLEALILGTALRDSHSLLKGLPLHPLRERDFIFKILGCLILGFILGF